MQHLLLSSAVRVETPQYQMVVGQLSSARVVQKECPCREVTRQLSIGTRWGNPQRSRTRPSAQRKPNEPHLFLESSASPPQRDTNENRFRWEIVEQLTVPFKSLIAKPSNDEAASREPGAGMLRRPLRAHREPA